MTLSEQSREKLLRSFNTIQPAFLSALDQLTAEMAEVLRHNPGRQDDSILACADAMADPVMLSDAVFRFRPDIKNALSEVDLQQAHVLAVSYLLSLSLHQIMRHSPEVPLV